MWALKIETFLVFWSILITAFVMHELGHFFYFKWFIGRTIELRFTYDKIKGYIWIAGYKSDYVDLTPQEKKGVYWAGIITGLFVIALASCYNLLFLSALPAYAYGSWSDILKIRWLNHEMA